MLLPEDRVKEVITHPEAGVRRAALRYFTESWSTDETVMPRVIEAVEAHDHEAAFRLLRDAVHLPQTPRTLDWLLGELRKEYDLADVHQDNYRFAIALIVKDADPGLLADRRAEARALLPESLREQFDDRMRLAGEPWAALWEELKSSAREMSDAEDGLDTPEWHRLRRLVEALARHPEEGARPVLDALRQQYRRDERELMQWLDPEMIRLAGAMRLEKAIPLILKRLDEPGDAVQEEIGRALGRIGTDEVIQQINPLWWKADWGARLTLSEPLERIHSELAVDRALRYLEREPDEDIAVHLGMCALSHFDNGAIEPVRSFILQSDPDNREIAHLRHDLVAAAQILNARFPEFEDWHAKAVETEYGLIGVPPHRLSKVYHGDMAGFDEFLDDADAGKDETDDKTS